MQLSVTMIVFNGASFIEEALDSIFGQTRAADEVVVWDDGSTDDTLTILKKYESQLRLIRSLENQGAQLARRAVVEAAKYDYISFLDADDRFVPGALAAFEERAHQVPSADLLFGMMRNFYDLPSVDGGGPRGGDWFHARTNGNMLAKKEAFLRASNRVEEAERSEFIAWYQASEELGLSEEQVEAPIFERRIHQSNASRHPDTRREMMEMLKAKLDQKRQQQT